MPFKMGVLLIHGMGNQDRGFAAPMIDELKARVRKKGGDDHQIAFQEVWWAPVLADKEETLLRRMSDGNDLEWMDLRRFVMHSLADAIAYQDTNRPPTSPDQINVYRQVHHKIGEAMKTLRERIRAALVAAGLAQLRTQEGYAPAGLAVPGTNGKTTVTALTGQLVAEAGPHEVGVIGQPSGEGP